ncbi:MAG: dNTP triphosphohydrolase [Candidatus Caenarcaniphilales bacterium]|nr:dNTP triphosphohydrolase [Candidatus Caenarcaniphilales bacterium]
MSESFKPFYNEADYERVKPHENEDRDHFSKDLGRCLHSHAFRRLSHKTQLLPTYESDFARNRLTHSLEVAQIARDIAEERVNLEILKEIYSSEEKEKKFYLNLYLVELAGLIHDIGHPPFGHKGEDALHRCMKDSCGFEGNAQSLRIVSKLEKKTLLTRLKSIDDLKKVNLIQGSGEDNRCGLNLTYRSMASLLKYDKKSLQLVRKK